MRAQLQRVTRNRNGFSLVEQVVAIASVAVVAAVVVPTVVNQLEKSELSRMESDLRAIEKAAKDFRTDLSYWPGDIEHLSDPITAADTAQDAYGAEILSTVWANWSGPYFEPKSLADVDGEDVITSAAGTYFTNLLEDASLTTGGTTETYLLVKLNNVSEAAAERLSKSIDNEDVASLTAGRIQWTEDGTTGKGTLTYYAGPIN